MRVDEPDLLSGDRRKFLRDLAALGIAVGVVGQGVDALAGVAGPVTLRYNQYEGLASQKFFKKFPDKVQLVSRNSEPADIAAIRAGQLKTDVLEVSGPYAQNFTFQLDILEPIDVTRLSHWKDLYPQWQAAAEFKSGGKQMAIPNNWGTDSMIVNTKKVRNTSSIGVLFDKSLPGKVAMPHDGNESTAVAAMYLGFKRPFSPSDKELEQIKKLLISQKPKVRSYWSTVGDLVNLFTNGEVVAAWGWLPVYTTLKRHGFPVAFASPKEGQIRWSDGNGIYKGTKYMDEAYKLMDYLISPEYLKPFYDSLGYRTCSKVVTAMLTPKQRRELQLDNPAPIMRHSVPWISPPQKTAKKIDAMWSEVLAA